MDDHDTMHTMRMLRAWHLLNAYELAPEPDRIMDQWIGGVLRMIREACGDAVYEVFSQRWINGRHPIPGDPEWGAYFAEQCAELQAQLPPGAPVLCAPVLPGGAA